MILEASISRIYNDFKENEFAMITAWRVGDIGNKSNQSQLKSQIQSAGFGYVRIDGVGQEEKDGKLVSASEPTLLVKNVKNGGEPLMDSKKFANFMFKLAKQYDQWGIVLSNPTEGVRLIAFKDEDGNSISPKVYSKLSKFSPGKTGEFFSKLKGRTFKFEGFKYGDPHKGWVHGMALQSEGEVDIYRRETTERWMNTITSIIEKSIKNDV
jgi:hypothetical protein